MQSRKGLIGALGAVGYPIILLLLWILVAIPTPPIDCSSAMKRLYEDLFSDYNKLILPVANNRSKVTVTLGLKLGQILDLNLKQQILSTNVWVEQSWFDYKLTWDPEKYQGIDMIHVPAENIWIPDIVLFNNADGNYELTMITRAKVFYNGSVVWKPPTMYKSTCEIDVEYFPFDVQMCLLRFGSWTYAGDEVELRHIDQKDRKVDIGIDLTEFHKNVEWDIIEVPASYNEEFYDCCTEPYPDITFKIVIRRKILFYMVNLILPTAVMAFMTIFVFYLPSKSDEKVTLSISILISLIVFFLLMLEIIPASSLAVPLFGKYLLFTLVLVSTSTCVTVFVLNIHYRSPSVHTMSPWMKKIFLETLPWWLGINRPNVKERSSLMRFRKKRARKLLNHSTNRIFDSSMTTNGNIQQQQPFSISKLSDLLEETEEEDDYDDDQGRYFRRHIDKYRHRCPLHSTIADATNESIGDYTQQQQQQKKSYGRKSRQTPASNMRQRSTPTMFTSLDSTTTEPKTAYPICHCCTDNLDNHQQLANNQSSGINQQQKNDNNNNNNNMSNNNGVQARGKHNCPLATVRHPLDACMPNEDTLDMTFDYDDELPTPPPPPPMRPASKLSLNNETNQQLMTTMTATTGAGTFNFDHQPLDVASSSSNDHEGANLPIAPFMQPNLDSSINGDDDDSNNVPSESIQSSLMNQGPMIQNSTLDARLLLDSSLDNNDSGQTILTRQADSCTCCDPIQTSQGRTYRGFGDAQQHRQGAPTPTQQQPGPPASCREHQSQQIQLHQHRHQQPQGRTVSSNYSTSTVATIPPPPQPLQSTLPSQQQQQHHHHHQFYSTASRHSNHDPSWCYCNDHDCQSCGANPVISSLSNARGDTVATSRSNQLPSSSLLMSLKMPYDRMPAHVKAAIRSILFIADTIKNEDVENRAVEDWNFMSMVIDRLFLWIFSVLCSLGSFMLLMFAPSLYDNRPSIDDILRVDIPMSNCSAGVHETLAAR